MASVAAAIREELRGFEDSCLRSPGLCLQEMGTQRALSRGSGRSDERITQEPVLRAGTKDEEDHEDTSQKMLCNFKMPQLGLLW